MTTTTSTTTTGGTTDPGSGRVARLAGQAADAAAVRALTTHPDVIALRVEKVRAQVDALLWAGIVLGLAFTMVNVQQFAAAGAAVFSPGWWVAWLLDPMVSLVLLAVLRAEQVTARYQVAMPIWARRTKWLTFTATYVMNTWTSWGLAAGTSFSAAGVVLHSVPPLVVFFAAETGPGLRDRLTEAVHRALIEHADAAGQPEAVRPSAVAVELAGGSVTRPATDATPVAASKPRRRPVRRPRPRRLLPEFIATARAALDTARAGGQVVEPTPVWCQQVSGCSAGTSVKVAAALRAAPESAPTAPAAPALSVESRRAA